MNMVEPRHFSNLRGRLTLDAPLARHTTWRAGGRADATYLPADRDDLAMFLRQIPVFEKVTVLGLGSNVLVRDGGVRGVVILMHNPGAALAVSDGLVYADAGVATPKLARFAAMHGCAGSEFFAGIPGTVGGALAMNAGCYGGETWTHVVKVEVLTRSGQFTMRTPFVICEMDFWLIRPSVCGVRPTWSERKSDWEKTSSMATSETEFSRAMTGATKGS